MSPPASRNLSAMAVQSQKVSAAGLGRQALGVLEKLQGRVVVVGSLNADLTVETARLPRPGETVIGGPLSVRPGGKSANQAVACALLGVPTGMLGTVGKDAHGEMLIDSLEHAGVDVTSVLSCDTATGTALITVDSGGENTIVVSAGANAVLGGDDVLAGASTIRDADVLGLCLEVGDEALLAAVRTARDAATTTVLNPSPLRDLPDELLELTDVLVANEHEFAVLTSGAAGQGDEQGLGALARLGVDRAVVTLGSRGCVVLDAGEALCAPAFPVKAVDTTGCGDAFTGALLAALASGIPLGEGAALAGAAAAIAATRVGAQSSYAGSEELRSFLRGE